MQLSKNFYRGEFSCQCGCGFDTVDTALVEALQRIRDHFCARVTINSACRCLSHNTNVGGAKKSQHVLGRAADIVVDSATPLQVQNYVINNIPHISVGRYENFTHIDSRSELRKIWGDQ